MKLPALHFYVGDWRKDIGVQSLDYEARGVWIEMLCLMHESEERGKLTLKGKPMGKHQLSRLLGLTEDAFGKIFDRLIEAGVPSIAPDGTIFSRRMVRDEDGRQKRAEGGKLGGNPNLGVNYDKPGFVYAIQRASDGAVKIGISSTPSTRLYKIRYQQKCECEMLAFAHVEKMGSAERSLHSKYSQFKNGEWFLLPESFLKDLVSTLKSTLKGKREDEDEDDNKVHTSSSGGVGGGGQLAEEIYQLYPLKAAKPQALIAIGKALKLVTSTFLRERTEAYAKAVKGTDTLIPHPATWFNGHRFNDDPSTWVKSGRMAHHSAPSEKDYEESWNKPFTPRQIAAA